MMKKTTYLKILMVLCFSTVFGQATTGPTYIKAQLTASGVYSAPDYEFTTAYDSYNSSTANGTIKGMFFDGLPYSEAANGNNETKVFCWYGEPAGLTAGEKVPAVILVHGGGGRAYTEWVDEWISRGYIAIAMSQRGTVPDDADTWEFGGPSQGVFFEDNDKSLQDQWFYHAIANIMLSNSLLRDASFTDHVDTNNIGVTGISWGGIETTVVAGIDERLDFAIPVYGCGFLYDSPVYSRQLASMTSTAQKFYLDNWEPSLYAPLHSAPMLFVDGNKDLQFTLNIFGKTYEASGSTEKFLRIEDLMGHGHGAGRRPQEIYDFADYVTSFNGGDPKPLTFTSETIDDDKNVLYEYNFEGTVDEAVLYYSKDTLEWGKADENYVWLSKNATLTKGVNSGTITTTVPDDAQVYYINVNNTTDNLMYSSVIKYAQKYYDWYDYTSNVFHTIVSNVSGGTLTNEFVNPDTSGRNKSTKVDKFEKTAGNNSEVVFDLTENITDLSVFKQKIKVYAAGNISSSTHNKIRVQLTNASVDSSINVSVDAEINLDNSWQEYTFDFTGKTIPTTIANAGGFDKMTLVFAPGDISTNGTVYYFDDIRSTIEQPEYVAPPTFYPWLNFTKSPSEININKYRDVGGDYVEAYDVSQDTDIVSSGETVNIATKFTKIAGAHANAQVNYNFEDGAIDSTSVTFVLRALFKPETIEEINILDQKSTSITMILRNSSGDFVGDLGQISSTTYFTQTNNWENLEFTFTSEDLKYYDQLLILFVSGYTHPIDEDGQSLEEDLVYYYNSLTATSSLVDESLSTEEYTLQQPKITLNPSPTSKDFSLSEEIETATVYNMLGKKVKMFSHNQKTYDVSNLVAGVYCINLKLLDGRLYSIRFVKS